MNSKISRLDFFKAIGCGGAGVAFANFNSNAEQPHLVEGTVMTPPEAIAAGVPTSVFVGYPSTCLMDVQYGRVYDRFRFRPGDQVPTIFRAFTRPLGFENGQNLSMRTLADTNMVCLNRLPAPQSMYVEKIHFLLDQSIKAEDLNILKTYGWRFQIGQKRYDEGPLFADITLADIDQVVESREPLRRSHQMCTHPGDLGLAILSEMFFEIEFISEAGPHATAVSGNGIDLYVALEGIVARGVQ